MADRPFVPYVPADQSMAEFTVTAVVLGCVLGVVMTAANTYLGLYAGMTVSASIPAAVISMGILRGILRRGTILENNIVQTIASAGESIAAGIIFTIPALVITGVWEKFYFWPVTLISVLGGMLGVLFMIPLRRALIVEEVELKYPEGRACAEVLKAGEKGGWGVVYVSAAIVVGAVLKFLITGVAVIAGVVEGATRVGRTALYFGCNVSPALVAVGYIVGFNIGLLFLLGGGIGWLLGLPIYYLFAGGFPADSQNVVETMRDTWEQQIRYMGVGAMIVGGVWSIVSVRNGIAKGIRGALAGYQDASTGTGTDRTQTDMNTTGVLSMLVPTAILIFVLYVTLTGSLSIGLFSGVIMIVTAFFFVAVSSYIVGLVGSSNNPVSGMTISTVLFASLLLVLCGMSGSAGILATLVVAGVVCCAACTAGDVSQDLKTGYLVGATPYKQQWAQVIGVLVPAVIIAPILTVLHSSYGIGMRVRPDVEPLLAPQANLFASITQATFNPEESMPWIMIVVGVGVGLVLVVLDELLRRRGSEFRIYVMPVAVGIYLPWSLGIPVFLGSVASLVTEWIVGRTRVEETQKRGVLIGSGLIAGEALTGIVIAFLIFFRGKKLPEFPLRDAVRDPLSIAVLLAVIVGIMFVAIKGRSESQGGDE